MNKEFENKLVFILQLDLFLDMRKKRKRDAILDKEDTICLPGCSERAGTYSETHCLFIYL